MVSQAGAVVIGAGAFGLSAAYHLAKLGVRDVVVVERFRPASQTSPRAAGLFKSIQSDEVRTRLSALAIRKVSGFEAETGVPLPVIRSGSLKLARTPEHAAFVREEARRAAAWGVEHEIVDEATAARLAPYLEGRGLLASCHFPADCFVEEPISLLNAYLEAGRRLGVTVLGETPVTGIRLASGEVQGVVTSRGEIRAPVVVDAAGAWARIVAGLGGAAAPVVPVRHQLTITEPIGGIAAAYPILRIIDTAVYVRPARGGLMAGGFESDPLPVDPRAAGPDFSMDDVPLDLGVVTRLTATVLDQVPALRDARLAEHRGGLFTMTPDGNFLVGPIESVRGFWIASGCNGSGFSFSPALGQMLAEWITAGAPSIDLSGLAPARFRDLALDEEGLRAAGIWQYAHYYDPYNAAVPALAAARHHEDDDHEGLHQLQLLVGDVRG